ncbi:MAG: hypothetical protein AAGA20_07745 [Planctomycetota bacterium]
MKTPAITALFVGGALAAATASTEPTADTVEVGSKPSYSFRQSVLNGQGLQSLADLKGKPTLVDFWGTK